MNKLKSFISRRRGERNEERQSRRDRKKGDFGVKSKPNSATVIACVLLVGYSLTMLFLFVWAMTSSVKSQYDFAKNPFGLPEEWNFSNYMVALTKFSVPVMRDGVLYRVGLPAMLLNSLIYSLGCTIVNTTVTCCVAYVTSKYCYKFSKVVYGIVIFTMVMPIVGSLPSELSLARSLHIYDTFWGMFIMKANFLGMNYLIFYAAFKNLPWDYAEAAFMDGASHFKVMVKVMIPMVKPVILIVMLLAFIGYWNDYYVPMMFMPNHPVAAYGLFRYQQSTDSAISTTPMKISGCMIVFMPIFVLFLTMKNKLIGNLTIGGLKG